MKLVIAEYLRTLRERDELDRLLPDLLVEMGYIPVARPQTGNRQFGVDLAARGENPETGQDELLLLVIKQGDIGRTEWDGGNQAIRPSINEIFDTYLRSHLEPQDMERKHRIIVTTNGELKQVVQAGWCGVVETYKEKAAIEFWCVDHLAELVERHLLDEHIFQDEDRKLLRRSLALSGDSDYDQRDLHLLFLRTLGLTNNGEIAESSKSQKTILKAIQVVNLSAHIFASWASKEGDSRQGIRAMERALLWTWHRLLLADEKTRTKALESSFSPMWRGLLSVNHTYFQKLQGHCHIEDGLSGYYSASSEFSLVAFEQIGFLAMIGLVQIFTPSNDEGRAILLANATVVGETLAAMIDNNGICTSPCLDRHSQDITLALMLLVLTNQVDAAKTWLLKLVRNIDYAYKSKTYVPVCTDSLDDLAEDNGWNGGPTEERLMHSSWTLPTLAGWCAILDMENSYQVLTTESKESYPEVCMQLWHPDLDIYKYLYFKQAQFDCGATEAPIRLPENTVDWRTHMGLILDSDHAKIAEASIIARSGLPGLDIIACRHFSTPLAPYFWYQFSKIHESKPKGE